MAAAAGLLLRPTLLLAVLLLLSSPARSLDEAESLLKLKGSFSNAGALSSWLPGSSPCARGASWSGVVCKRGAVAGLRLGGMGLSGKVDVSALLELKSLRTVSLVNNSLTGSIPEFDRLGALKGLHLSSNQFSGNIPTNYFDKMNSLKQIWLSDNKFSGEIPLSLARVPRLVSLHLENNEFSGSIPSIAQSTLKSVNMSNNKLDGEIPSSMLKFGTSVFAGNAGVCGQTMGKACSKQEEKSAEPNNNAGSSTGSTDNGAQQTDGNGKNTRVVAAAVATSGVVLVSIALVVVVRTKQKPVTSDVLGNVKTPETAEKRQPSVHKREAEPIKRGNNPSKRGGSNHGKAGGGGAELSMVNEEKGVFGLVDLMKASAEVLGNGGLGSCYKAVMGNGMAVVVKRMREMNAIGKEGFDVEMRRFGNFRHQNILTPLAYHYRKDEKLMVYEYIPKGNLLYLLHGDRGESNGELDWPTRLKIVKGIARGMGFLHAELPFLDLPHGNLKSSNILLGPSFEPLLSDYGFCPMINPASRPQGQFAYKVPEAAQQGQVSPKCDVYCLGIVILELVTGKYPSLYANNGEGGIDLPQWAVSAISEGREDELLDKEIAGDDGSVGDMKQLLHIGAACTETDPEKRLDMNEAIRRIEEIKN